MKTLLFIGGTSFFGKLAVEQLVQSKQYAVTLLTRGKSNCPAGVSTIRCDRTNYAELKAALAGRQFDVVVDNIPNNGPDVLAVLEALQRQVGHYLLCSSATVYPDWHTPHAWTEVEAVLEAIPGQLPFANGKREAEKQLIEAGTVPYTIYRPTVVEGPGDPVKRTRYFVEKIRRQEKFFIPTDVILQHVYVDDVARALVELIELVPTNQAFNMSGDDYVPIQQYCDLIAEALHQPPCYEIVARNAFMATHSKDFPVIYDHTLLLANALLRQTIHFNPTPIHQWLPVTIQ